MEVSTQGSRTRRALGKRGAYAVRVAEEGTAKSTGTAQKISSRRRGMGTRGSTFRIDEEALGGHKEIVLKCLGS